MNPKITSALFHARTTLILLFILAMHPGFSQSTFGLRAGPQLTTAPGGSMRLSYHAGIFATTRISDNVFLGADILYSEKGFKKEELDGEARLGYLSIPIIVDYNFVKVFSVLGGIEFNRLISSEYTGKRSEYSLDHDYAITNVDWAVVTGLGFQLHPKWNAAIRYSFALTSRYVYNHNQALQLSLGYYLNKGGRSIPASHTSDSSWISCGVKAGLNFSDTYYDNSTSQEDVSQPRLGGLFGFYIHARILKSLSLIGEFQYIRKGYNLNDDDDKVPVLFDYIEVPLLLSFDFGKRISLDVGTSFGYRVNESIPKELEREYRDPTTDKGIILGGRWRTKQRMSFGGRIYHGYKAFTRYGVTKEYFRGLQFFTYYRL